MSERENLGRRLERRLFSATLDGAARAHFATRPERWRPELLRPHRYCLLASYRRDGRAVPTPLWFAPFEDGFCFRTGAGSAKVARLRRDPVVAVAPCTWRGRPLGPPSAALVSFLAGESAAAAEAALRQRYGSTRALYTKAQNSEAGGIYLKIGPRPCSPRAT